MAMIRRGRALAKRMVRNKNENGAVMVELGLVLPFLAVMILFLLVCYEVVDSYFEMQVGTFAELRRKCQRIEYTTGDNFQYVEAATEKLVVVKGTLPRVIGTSFIPLEVKMSTYAGSWKGRGKSIYYRSPVRYSY